MFGPPWQTFMTEEEFDAFIPNRPFRHADLKQVEADAGRLTALGLALWGRTPADLKRQLDAPHPEIPAGCTLPDLLRLQRYLQRLSAVAAKPQSAWFSPLLSSLCMLDGPRALTGLEARFEVVLRASKYLEDA
jgi:hypothetical protein